MDLVSCYCTYIGDFAGNSGQTERGFPSIAEGLRAMAGSLLSLERLT